MGMKHGSFYTEAAYMCGRVYVVSGDQVDSVAAVESYGIFSNTWNRCTAMPEKLMFVSAAASQARQNLYVTGGILHATGRFSNSIFRYESKSDAWTKLESELQYPRYLTKLNIHTLFLLITCQR